MVLLLLLGKGKLIGMEVWDFIFLLQRHINARGENREEEEDVVVPLFFYLVRCRSYFECDAAAAAAAATRNNASSHHITHESSNARNIFGGGRRKMKIQGSLVCLSVLGRVDLSVADRLCQGGGLRQELSLSGSKSSELSYSPWKGNELIFFINRFLQR